MKVRILAIGLGLTAISSLSVTAQTAPASTTAPTPAAAAPSVAAAAPAAAPAPPAPPAWAFTFTPSYVSSYMFRGQRLGGDSFEPAFEGDYGNWAIGVWSNMPIDNKVPGQSDPEIDPYGSYTFTLSDTLKLQPGFTWYNYPRAPEDQGFYKATFEPNIALPWTLGGLTLTPKVYYDVVLDAPTFEINGAFTVPLKDLGTELDFSGSAGDYILYDGAYHTTPKVHIWGDYWLLGVAVPYQVSKAAKLSVGYAYTQGTNGYIKQVGRPRVSNSEAVGRGVLSVSLAISF